MSGEPKKEALELQDGNYWIKGQSGPVIAYWSNATQTWSPAGGAPIKGVDAVTTLSGLIRFPSAK